jgi:hypothetical protein
MWAAPGALTLAAGLGILAPAVPGTIRRWLSPALAVLATATIAAGVVTHLQGSGCHNDHDPRRCSQEVELRDRGALLLLSGAPLFSLPVVHLGTWIRRGKSSRIDASLTVRAPDPGAHLLLRL